MELIENLNLSNENSFFENTFSNIINGALEAGLRMLLPDKIENEVINVKDAFMEQGFPGAIKETINSAINIGKKLLGNESKNFENIDQIGQAFKDGKLIEGVSNTIDFVLDKIEKSNILPEYITNIIKSGKNILLNCVSNDVNNELVIENKNINKLKKYTEKWKEEYNNRDFNSMEKTMKKINSIMEKIAPIESVINEAKSIENMHDLIKNNGQNFELNYEEKELAKLL